MDKSPFNNSYCEDSILETSVTNEPFTPVKRKIQDQDQDGEGSLAPKVPRTPTSSRRSYSIEFKLSCVEETKSLALRCVARKYGLGPTTLRNI